jgi:hypothetical protein
VLMIPQTMIVRSLFKRELAAKEGSLFAKARNGR